MNGSVVIDALLFAGSFLICALVLGYAACKFGDWIDRRFKS